MEGREEKIVKVRRCCYVAWAVVNALAMAGGLVCYFMRTLPQLVAPELVVYCCVLLDLIVVDCCQLHDRTRKAISRWVVWSLIVLNASAFAGDLACYILVPSLPQDHQSTAVFTGEVTFYCCVLLNLVPLIYSEEMGGATAGCMACALIGVDVAAVLGCLGCYIVDVVWLCRPHLRDTSRTVELVVGLLMPYCLVFNIVFLLSSKIYDYFHCRRRLSLVHHHPDV